MELTWYGLSIKEVITHSVHLHAMNVKNGWHYQTGAVAHRLANTGIATLNLSSPAVVIMITASLIIIDPRCHLSSNQEACL